MLCFLQYFPVGRARKQLELLTRPSLLIEQPADQNRRITRLSASMIATCMVMPVRLQYCFSRRSCSRVRRTLTWRVLGVGCERIGIVVSPKWRNLLIQRNSLVLILARVNYIERRYLSYPHPYGQPGATYSRCTTLTMKHACKISV